MELKDIIQAVSINKEVIRDRVNGSTKGCRPFITFHLTYAVNSDAIEPLVEELADRTVALVRNPDSVDILTDESNRTISLTIAHSHITWVNWSLEECEALRDLVLNLAFRHGWVIISDGYIRERMAA
jgi:hypothetical protein